MEGNREMKVTNPFYDDVHMIQSHEPTKFIPRVVCAKIPCGGVSVVNL